MLYSVHKVDRQSTLKGGEQVKIIELAIYYKMRKDEALKKLDDAGFLVEAKYGTFSGSMQVSGQYKEHGKMKTCHLKIFGHHRHGCLILRVTSDNPPEKAADRVVMMYKDLEPYSLEDVMNISGISSLEERMGLTPTYVEMKLLEKRVKHRVLAANWSEEMKEIFYSHPSGIDYSHDNIQGDQEWRALYDEKPVPMRDYIQRLKSVGLPV
jgi:hypothetical protein